MRDKQQIHPPTEKPDKITCLKADLLLIEKLSYYVLFEWLKLDLNDTHVSTNNLVFSKYERWPNLDQKYPQINKIQTLEI